MVWFPELFEAFVFATAYFATTDRDMESFPVLFWNCNNKYFKDNKLSFQHC